MACPILNRTGTQLDLVARILQHYGQNTTTEQLQSTAHLQLEFAAMFPMAVVAASHLRTYDAFWAAARGHGDALSFEQAGAFFKESRLMDSTLTSIMSMADAESPTGQLNEQEVRPIRPTLLFLLLSPLLCASLVLVFSYDFVVSSETFFRARGNHVLKN